jgi:hypothetical protein
MLKLIYVLEHAAIFFHCHKLVTKLVTLELKVED